MGWGLSYRDCKNPNNHSKDGDRIFCTLCLCWYLEFCSLHVAAILYRFHVGTGVFSFIRVLKTPVILNQHLWMNANLTKCHTSFSLMKEIFVKFCVFGSFQCREWCPQLLECKVCALPRSYDLFSSIIPLILNEDSEKQNALFPRPSFKQTICHIKWNFYYGQNQHKKGDLQSIF